GSDQAACRPQPRDATSAELTRIKRRKHALKSIVRRNALWQPQKPLEPGLATSGKLLDIRPIITIADNTTDGHDDNVDQQMLGSAYNARIFQSAKVFLDRTHGRSSSHACLRIEEEIPEHSRGCTLV